MKNLLSRASAALATLAIVASYALVPAADAAVLGSTIASANDNTLTINFSGLAGDIVSGDEFRVTVRTLDNGEKVNISNATAVHGDDGVGDDGTFTPAAYNTTDLKLTWLGADSTTQGKFITITDTGEFATDEDYFVTVTMISGADAGNFTTGTIIKSTQNQIQVIAVVEPTLTLDVNEATIIDFGTLIPGSDNEATNKTTVTFTTNANSGVVIAASAEGNDDADGAGPGTAGTANVLGEPANNNTIAAISAKNLTAAAYAGDDDQEYFGIEVENLVQTKGDVKIDAAFHSADADTVDTTINAFNGATDLVNASGAPIEGGFDVAYHAGITSITPAGNYGATVTYTATATF